MAAVEKFPSGLREGGGSVSGSCGRGRVVVRDPGGIGWTLEEERGEGESLTPKTTARMTTRTRTTTRHDTTATWCFVSLKTDKQELMLRMLCDADKTGSI